MTDTFKHKGLRKKLTEELSKKGITSKEVLEAIERVPRHLFLDNAFLEFAYQDKAFPIGAGQTISQPYTVAFQSELLKISKGEKVLEIGTGSGYQTCVLLEMGAKVYTIERQRSLYDKTRILLPKLGYGPRFFYGDGYKGLPVYAPFDKIIVTAGAPTIPDDLLHQVKVGGIIVIPVGSQEQEMLTLTKISETEVLKKSYGSFRFVPLLQNRE